MTKILLVGRHDPKELEANGYEVVATENVNFDLNVHACELQFISLRDKARQLNAALVFQNVPGILAVAMMKWYTTPGLDNLPVGVVISRPGPRLAGQKLTRTFVGGDQYSEPSGQGVADLVLHANGRAKVEFGDVQSLGEYSYLDVTVTVDPVPAFEFVKVEWFVAPQKEKKPIMQFPGGL